jgi:hypothetical protein
MEVPCSFEAKQDGAGHLISCAVFRQMSAFIEKVILMIRDEIGTLFSTNDRAVTVTGPMALVCGSCSR